MSDDALVGICGDGQATSAHHELPQPFVRLQATRWQRPKTYLRFDPPGEPKRSDGDWVLILDRAVYPKLKTTLVKRPPDDK